MSPDELHAGRIYEDVHGLLYYVHEIHAPSGHLIWYNLDKELRGEGWYVDTCAELAPSLVKESAKQIDGPLILAPDMRRPHKIPEFPAYILEGAA